MRYLLYLIVVLGVLTKVASPALAQPVAPEIACLRGDTLTWADPMDPCGPLTDITIFAAEEISGPYISIRTVAAGIEFYWLTVAEAQQYNAFYVVGNYGCSPPTSEPSDTITTDPLLVPSIQTVDFTVFGTILTWEPVDDPRVTGTLVYRDSPSGLVLLDEVSGNTYTDLLTQTESSGTNYYLGSIDDCLRSSFDASPYSSLTLAATRDACAGELNIGRLLPSPWPREFTRAFVARRTIRGTIDTVFLSQADSLITLPDYPPDTAYSVRVTYVDTRGGSTTSFPVDLPAQRVVVNDTLEIAQVTFEANTWQFRWRWNPIADYTNINWEVTRGTMQAATGSLPDDENNLPAPIVDLGLGADFDWTNATVRVSATDACGVTRSSIPARPAIVRAEEAGIFDVNVAWSLAQFGDTQLDEWSLRLLDAGGSRLLFTTDDATTFVHNVEQVNDREVCYQLVTNVTLPALLERGEARYQSRSAPGCTLRTPRVYLPTGFIPEGYTIEYRPRLSLIEGLDFEMKIYDRWGKIQFESTDPFVGWLGGIGGQSAPAGAYLAVVELKEEGSAPIQVETLFILIR